MKKFLKISDEKAIKVLDILGIDRGLISVDIHMEIGKATTYKAERYVRVEAENDN